MESTQNGPTRKPQAPTVNYNLTTLRRLSLAKKTRPQKSSGAQSDAAAPVKDNPQRRKEPVLKLGRRLSRHGNKAPLPDHHKIKQAKTHPNKTQSHPQERIDQNLLPTIQEPTAGTSTTQDSSIVTAMTLQYLQTQIHRWLIKTGHNGRVFHYLLTYSPPSGENKENIEVEIEVPSTSFADLETSTKEKKELKLDFLDAYALLALVDLKKMISQGFPVEYGIPYLEMIESNHESLLRNPVFWIYKGEVLEASGHISLAVQCYKMAITCGAKKRQVARRLDGILEKFCVAVMNQKKKHLPKHQTQMIDEVKEIFRKVVDILP